jgi:hypothetical protein
MGGEAVTAGAGFEDVVSRCCKRIDVVLKARRPCAEFAWSCKVSGRDATERIWKLKAGGDHIVFCDVDGERRPDNLTASLLARRRQEAQM